MVLKRVLSKCYSLTEKSDIYKSVGYSIRQPSEQSWDSLLHHGDRYLHFTAIDVSLYKSGCHFIESLNYFLCHKSSVKTP